MTILQTTENVLPYKPSCALFGLHTSCFSLPFLALVLTEPGFISLPVLSHTAVPTVLPAACPPSFISCGLPSCSPLSSHLCLLPSLSSDSGFTCCPAHLTAFHFTTHSAPASTLFPIISQFEVRLPHLLPYLPITTSIPVSFSLHLLSSLPPLSVSALVFALLHSQETPNPHISVWMLKLFAFLSSTASLISHFNHAL